MRIQSLGPVAHVLRTISVHLPSRNFITIHYAYFIGTCLAAHVIFWGSSSPPGSVSHTDTLFFAVSAMTLAGLNTVNLSKLNTFQRLILFALIMLGSAYIVSIAQVHIRRKAFERRFKSIVEDQRRQRRERNAIKQRLGYVVPSSRRQTGPAVDDINVRGKVLNSTPDQPHDKSKCLRSRNSGNHPPGDRNQEHDLPHGLSQEDNRVVCTVGDDDSVPLDNGLARRIAFNTSISPTLTRQHTRVFSMQGVGA